MLPITYIEKHVFLFCLYSISVSFFVSPSKGADVVFNTSGSAEGNYDNR